MTEAGHHIRTLRLRVHGLSPLDARRLGVAVAHQVAAAVAAIPGCRPRGHVELRVQLPAGMPHERWPAVIGRKVTDALATAPNEVGGPR
jgi:hypothetical protein